MKFTSLLITFLLMSSLTFGQKKQKTDFNKGIPILISGIGFTIGAVVTPMEYTGGPGSKITPYYLQTAQIASLSTGVVLTGTGIVTWIFDRKGRKWKKRKR